MDQHTTIAGTAGNIEVALPATTEAGSQWAVFCHPHPLYGGSMDDAVVAAAVRAFERRGTPCLRFNFRSVGASEGAHDNGRGETDDCLTVLDWLRRERGAASFTLVGYSFGSYVAWQAQARGDDIDRVLLIAPILGHMDYSAPARSGIEVAALVGSVDSFVGSDEVDAWAAPDTTVRVLEGADHFFSGCWAELEEAVATLA